MQVCLAHRPSAADDLVGYDDVGVGQARGSEASLSQLRDSVPLLLLLHHLHPQPTSLLFIAVHVHIYLIIIILIGYTFQHRCTSTCTSNMLLYSTRRCVFVAFTPPALMIASSPWVLVNFYTSGHLQPQIASEEGWFSVVHAQCMYIGGFAVFHTTLTLICMSSVQAQCVVPQFKRVLTPGCKEAQQAQQGGPHLDSASFPIVHPPEDTPLGGSW